MLQFIRICRILLVPALLSGTAIHLTSCASPTATVAAGPRTSPGPSNWRHRYGGTATRPDQGPVAETTRDNFFTWLFSIDGTAAKPKKTAKPAPPVIPATKVNSLVLARSTKGNTKIVIDVSRQKAFLLVDGAVAIESPVSTARPGKYTPRGNFRISERVRSGKVSTIYGVGMPYWMRLSGSVYGVHAGYLPGYPASAGCVRLPSDAAQLIYDNTRGGTPVAIYSSWSGA